MLVKDAINLYQINIIGMILEKMTFLHRMDIGFAQDACPHPWVLSGHLSIRTWKKPLKKAEKLPRKRKLGVQRGRDAALEVG